MLRIDERLIPRVFDFEECIILGYIWFSQDGVLKTNVEGVTVTPDKRFFIYNGNLYEPGLYYLVRRENRVFIASDNFLTMMDAKPLNSILEAKMRSRKRY
jgi:hypothetical protein